MIPVKTNNGAPVEGILRSSTGALVNRNKDDLIKYIKEKKLQDDLSILLSRIVALEQKIETLLGK